MMVVPAYYNYLPIGLSICIEGGVVDALHVYANNVQGYTQYPGTLPFGLTLAGATCASVVQTLGEPEAKGGGRSQPIFIVYRDKGLQVEFCTNTCEPTRAPMVGAMLRGVDGPLFCAGRWEDPDAGVASISFFPAEE